MSRDRTLPAPAGASGELYRLAASTGRLHLQRCAACDAWQHPPRLRCGACGGTELVWEPVAGRGRVFSWTITHRAIDPAFAGELPYAVVVVQLDEGPRVVGNLVEGVAVDVLALDLPVEIVLDRRSDAVALIDFRPVGA